MVSRRHPLPPQPHPPDRQRPLRVLQALFKLGHGGVAAWLLQLLDHLDRDRYQVEVLVAEETPARSHAALAALGCQVLSCQGWHAVDHARRFAALVADRGGYDVVHSHMGPQSGLLMRSARLAGVPVRIAHSRSSFFAPAPGLRGALYSVAARRWMLAHATHLLAVSAAAGRALFGPAATADPRFRLSHTALDLRPFHEPVAAAAVRRSLQLPADAPVAVHIGRFEAEKNQRFLVGLAADVLRRRPGVHFVLVGEGPERAAVEQEVSARGLGGAFRFAGARGDVANLLRGVADALVFPSIYEGLGRVVVEAQAAGVPCLVSEGVPPEAEVVSGLVTRLPLSAGPVTWADHLLGLLSRPHPVPHAAALAAVEASPFNMQTTAAELQQLWAGEP